MHREVLDWLRDAFSGLPSDVSVMEIGSRSINGSARVAAPGARWWGCDLQAGPGVDFVGEGEDASPPFVPDVVVCCEVLEHTPRGPAIVAHAGRLLRPGGVLLVTVATEPRAPHSAHDGGATRPGEYYQNVSAADLSTWLDAAGFLSPFLTVDPGRGDLFASAIKPNATWSEYLPVARMFSYPGLVPAKPTKCSR